VDGSDLKGGSRSFTAMMLFEPACMSPQEAIMFALDANDRVFFMQCCEKEMELRVRNGRKADCVPDISGFPISRKLRDAMCLARARGDDFVSRPVNALWMSSFFSVLALFWFSAFFFSLFFPVFLKSGHFQIIIL
jgi:hypothetical protein